MKDSVIKGGYNTTEGAGRMSFMLEVSGSKEHLIKEFLKRSGLLLTYIIPRYSPTCIFYSAEYYAHQYVL